MSEIPQTYTDMVKDDHRRTIVARFAPEDGKYKLYIGLATELMILNPTTNLFATYFSPDVKGIGTTASGKLYIK
jgi:hypothetical protein